TPEGAQDPIRPPDVEVVHVIPGYEHSKASSPLAGTPVVAGDEITYTLTGRNIGATMLEPVTIEDDLAGVLRPGVSLVGQPLVRQYDGFGDLLTSGVPEAIIEGSMLTWTGELAVGERVQITYTVVLGDDVEPGVTLENILAS